MSTEDRKPSTVFREQDRIFVYDLKVRNRVGNIVSEICKARERGYSFLRLEIRDDTAFPNVLAPLAAVLDLFRETGFEIELSSESQFLGIRDLISTPRFTLVPAGAKIFSRVWRFDDSSAANRLSSAVLDQLSQLVVFSPGVKGSLAWCVYEVMDNALRHSETARGYMSVQYHPTTQHVAISIADNGIGIFRSLGPKYRPPDALSAIKMAMDKGVTKDADGIGNGLFGLRKIVTLNGGILAVTSAAGEWKLQDGTISENPRWPYPDKSRQCTYIDFQIDTQRPISPSSVMDGFEPVDMNFDNELNEFGDAVISVRDWGFGVATRDAGARLRNYANNLINQGAKRVVFDFANVEIVASSFADETVGKLAANLGNIEFTRRVVFANANSDVKQLVGGAVSQRLTNLSNSN
ncbi:MAG TPA: DUF4325 domain-containing protein [Pirellulaceae bacterium]|nr:DUF4325 domain-containing protein [Pirellulaceae bacterium]